MSKMGDYAQEFLEDAGYSLGYDENNMPEFKDIEIVRTFNIHVWEYKGLTEYEYYGVDKNEGKTMP
tara:strand:+ start:237 stop:434 length:198 start_codon:yes stop_codon:yes gene_type:complete